MQRVPLIVLAAGRSQRFGGDKLLAVTDDGRTLIERTLSNYIHPDLPALKPVYVAVHESHGVLSAQVSTMQDCELVSITGEYRGLGVSIAQSVARIAQQVEALSLPPIEGWMIALADMPVIQTDTVIDMLKAFDGLHILQPKFKAAEGDLLSGHPVIFPHCFTEQLLQLNEDKGGRDILQRHPEKIKPFITTDPGILFDVDTRSDLNRLAI